jgi:CO/xanthine dehydrogenase Mo-binding subunit
MERHATGVAGGPERGPLSPCVWVEQSNFNNYRVLRMNETPPIDVRLVRNSEAPGGIGEPGTSVTAAALANAVYAATGKRLRKLPLQPGLASSTR